MTRFIVVADACCNHLGSMTLAKAMIRAAYDAGVDIIKFQYYKTEEIIAYERRRPDSLYTDELFAAIRETEFGIDQLRELKAYADELGIEWMCTPFLHVERLKELEEHVNPRRWKIRERDSHNMELIRAAVETGKEVFLSVREAPKDPYIVFNPHIKLLKCISRYPPRPDDLDLYDFTFFDGFSDHYPHITYALSAAVVALMSGKEEFIIEKHLKMPGTKPIDDAVSITPEQFARLVQHLRRLEECGAGVRKSYL